MINIENFNCKRHNLKDIVNVLNPTGYEYEIKTYDFIVKTCENQNTRTDSGLDKAFQPIHNFIDSKNKGRDGDRRASLDEVLQPILEVQDIRDLPAIVQEVKTRIKEGASSLVNDLKKETVYWKKQNKHDPAFIIVHNYGMDPNYDYESHLGKFDIEEELKDKYYLDPWIIKRLENIAHEDGAILVDHNQRIKMVHAYLIDFSEKDLIQKHYKQGVRQGYDHGNPRYFGFMQSISTRHLTALYASFHFPGSIIYTLGEQIESKDENDESEFEDGHIRRYENGLITFSTMNEESETVKRSLKILKENK